MNSLPARRPDIDAELEKVAKETKALLRERYRGLFGREPPKAFGPDLLRRSVAYRIQENAYGGLPKATQRLLDRLVDTTIREPAGRLVLPRRTQTGVVFVREWQGKSYRVTVLDEGFAYDGQTYASLSEIARLITGTRWNGPRFFGMRKREAELNKLAVKTAPNLPNALALRNSARAAHRDRRPSALPAGVAAKPQRADRKIMASRGT